MEAASLLTLGVSPNTAHLWAKTEWPRGAAWNFNAAWR
tara:strand:+ start:882 stop:995 length:114 start_codon:yes stop_codon:yes gene_type:complete